MLLLSRRQFPRLQMQMPAMLTLRPAANGPSKKLLPAVITTLSCEGAGLVPTASSNLRLRPGQPANLALYLNGVNLSLRSQIVWQGSASTAASTALPVVGLRLLLAACSRAERCAYTEWITEAMGRFVERDVLACDSNPRPG